MTGLMVIAAVLVIASVVVAIVANFDLDRQKKEVAKLEQTSREMAAQREHEEERHRLAQGTLEFTEKLKREAKGAIKENAAEIERLEEEEKQAEIESEDEGAGEGSEVEEKDPHAIKIARDPRRGMI